MVRRLAAFFMAFLLCLSMAVPSFASVATPSNAVPMVLSLDDGIATVASGDGSSTTDWGSVSMVAVGSYGQQGQDVTSSGMAIPEGTTEIHVGFQILNWVYDFVVLKSYCPLSCTTLSLYTSEGYEITFPADPYRDDVNQTVVYIPFCYPAKGPVSVSLKMTNAQGAIGHSVYAGLTNDYGPIEYNGLYYGQSTSKPSIYDTVGAYGLQVPFDTIYLYKDLSGGRPWYYPFQLVIPSRSSGDVNLFRGYEYSFYFNVYDFQPQNFAILYNGLSYWSYDGDSGITFKKLSDNVYKAVFTPELTMNLSEVQFVMHAGDSGRVQPFCTYYLSEVETSYIPKSDTAGQSQQTAANTTVIKNVVTNIENVVNNISNQITNMVTNITNAISDGVSQITQNDNQNTDKVVQADKENTDNIVQADKENTDKIISNDDKLHQEQLENDDENADQIMNGYDPSDFDDSNNTLNDSITQQQDQEQQIMDQISEPLDSFEFKDPIAQYLSTFKLFGDFLQDLFTNSGAFADVINLSFIMAIALMVAGLYRFKGGN